MGHEKPVQNVHAAEFNDDGIGDEDERALDGNAERIATAVPRLPSAQNLCLAVRKKYFLGNTKRRLGSVLDCFAPSCSPDEIVRNMKGAGV